MPRWFRTPLELHRQWKAKKALHKNTPCIAGRYRLIKQIGQGASSIVHLAINIKDNKYYAIKEINKSRLEQQYYKDLLQLSGPRRSTSFTKDQQTVGVSDVAGNKKRRLDTNVKDFLMKEFNLMKSIKKHNNIAQAIEMIEDPLHENSLFLVMEYAEKGVVMDISAHCSVKPYSDNQCRHLFKQLVDAVDHLHENNVIHRDIKPQNLLLTNDNILKLIDFGTASNMSSITSYSHGSPAFMAPELVKKGSRESLECVPTSGDLWAMGVTLYCLAYGCLPFSSTNIIELYDDIQKKKIVHPFALDNELTDLIDKLLEKRVEDRLTMEQIKVNVIHGLIDRFQPFISNSAIPNQPEITALDGQHHSSRQSRREERTTEKKDKTAKE